MSVKDVAPRRVWLKMDEAAEYLGMSETWLREQMERERDCKGAGLPYHKYGNSRSSSVRLHIDDLDAYAEAHRVGASR